ncbi:unnamed protein product [Parajaminaea phylloscopi]
MAHFLSAAIKKVQPAKEAQAQRSSPPLDEETQLSSPKAALKRTTSAHRQAADIPLSPLPPALGDDDKGKQRMLDLDPATAPPATDAVASSADPWSTLNRMPSIGGVSAGGPITPGAEESDPLLLRSRLVGETDLRRRATGGRKAERNMKRFYEEQNEHIERLLKPIHAHGQDDDEARQDNALKVKIAVYGSLAANCILAILQLYAAISSLSLSLFATAADSVFDPFANIALNWLHRKSVRVDERKWPAGGSRFENVGNCVYAFLMGAVSVILVVESIRDIASHQSDELKGLHIPSLVAVGIAFAVKLALFFYCMALRRFSSQIQVLWEDHRNDLGINGLGIITSALGSKVIWWLDPAGAMLISLIIIVSWTRTAAENFRQLAGQGAPPEFLQLVTYNCMLFHDKIECIDSCKAWHSGPKYMVEVDVVMAPNTPLWEAHDVAQDLQDKLESLPDVDRCFVHIDHDATHPIEHRKEK